MVEEGSGGDYASYRRRGGVLRNRLCSGYEHYYGLFTPDRLHEIYQR
jgi:hypothetical protein